MFPKTKKTIEIYYGRLHNHARVMYISDKLTIRFKLFQNTNAYYDYDYEYQVDMNEEHNIYEIVIFPIISNRYMIL